MLTEKTLKALNDQIALEMNSAYLYLGMAAWCEDQALPGFAHWLKVQYKEEVSHALRLFDYLADCGGRVTLEAIAKPAAEFGPPLKMFQEVLKHERKVTASIHRLYELALAEKDFATQSQLQWFVDEQVEEEKAAQEILRQLEMVKDHPHVLLMIDHRMGERKDD